MMKRGMKIGAAAVVGMMLLNGGIAYAGSTDKLKSGDFDFTLHVGDWDRHYIVHIPTSYNGTTPTPLVIMLHGAGGDSSGALEMGNWIPKSDSEGFIVAALDGLPARPNRSANFLVNPQIWNDGSDRGTMAANNIDDVGFINAVLDDLIGRGAIDQQRIFVTGFSNGASMTFRAGVELSKRVAAIAPISGHLWIPDPTLDQPVSLLLVIGDSDPLNPLNGGKALNPWGAPSYKAPMRDSLDAWTKALNCPSTATTIYNQDGVTGISYGPCKGGAEAQYYIVSGLGHNWADGVNRLPVSIVGPRSNAINTTDIVWAFFQKHPKS